MLTLRSGEYLGGILRRRRLFDTPVTLTAYPPGHTYPWHLHEAPTLFVLLAGEHRNENRQRSFLQSPLSIAFHPTVGPHATFVGPSGMIGINLELTDAWLRRCEVERRDLAAEYQLLDAMGAKLLGLRLAALAYGGDETDDAEVETVALELMACLLRERWPGRRAPAWLPRAVEFLRAHAGQPVRLRDVAAEVSVHPVYCARAFRRAVGCTVTEYLRVLRLLEAGQLILDRTCSLAEVALRVGFADQAHFTRACSRELGVTPGRLQRMRRELFPQSAGSDRSRQPLN